MDQSFDRTIGDSAWQLLSPKVDHFISCAQVVTDMLVRRGVAPERITCHHGFIQEPEVDPLRVNYIRRDLGIPPGAFVIGGMGRPDWRKAPEVFARMASAVTRLRPDLPIHFVWIGGPIDSSPGWQLTHDFEAMGLHGRFHFTGEIEDAVDVLGSLDAFALTSREDAYPLAVLEAAALDVPVVGFDNGGIVEFAAAGGSDPLAMVVPYLDVHGMAQEILRLFTEPGHADALADRARRYVTSNHLVEHGAPALFDTLASVDPRLGGLRIGPTGTAPASPGRSTGGSTGSSTWASRVSSTGSGATGHLTRSTFSD
jgi:glycosyltransferase involved in cell wall biosynthesis